MTNLVRLDLLGRSGLGRLQELQSLRDLRVKGALLTSIQLSFELGLLQSALQVVGV